MAERRRQICPVPCPRFPRLAWTIAWSLLVLGGLLLRDVGSSPILWPACEVHIWRLVSKALTGMNIVQDLRLRYNLNNGAKFIQHFLLAAGDCNSFVGIHVNHDDRDVWVG